MLSNPAGLASLGSGSASDLSLSFNSLLDTSYLGYAAFGQGLGGSGVLGADVVYFSQQAMTTYSGIGLAQGSFQPADWSAALAYARRFDGFSVGVEAKFIHSALADVSGRSAAVDLGAQAKSVFLLLSGGPVDLGAYFSNLGPPIKLGGVSSPLPFAAVAGLLWHGAPAFAEPSAASLPWDLDAGFDLHCPVDLAPYAALGLEAGFRFDGQRRKAAVRVGYNESSAGVSGGYSGLTAGVGLDLQSFRLDYAWAPFGDLGMQNRVTLALRVLACGIGSGSPEHSEHRRVDAAVGGQGLASEFP